MRRPRCSSRNLSSRSETTGGGGGGGGGGGAAALGGAAAAGFRAGASARAPITAPAAEPGGATEGSLPRAGAFLVALGPGAVFTAGAGAARPRALRGAPLGPSPPPRARLGRRLAL